MEDITSMTESGNVDHNSKNVLFLGYNRDKTILIDAMESEGCTVTHCDRRINDISGYDLVVSFGYRYIISSDMLSKTNGNVVNLHISYLPWNRGAHPNFWSFFDCTPSGVSIHLIDEGIDTGPIIFQNYVNFNQNEVTFRNTYNRLITEIEELFVDNIKSIIARSYNIKTQRRYGSFHKKSDLPKEFSGWDSVVDEEVRRLDSILDYKTIRKFG